MRLHDDSSLSLAEPAGIAELARLFCSASDLAEATARDLRRTAGGLITGDWSGHAATAFANIAAQIEGDNRSTTTALRHAATVLDRLSWDIGEARTAAVSAMRDADGVNHETFALNAAWEEERAAGSSEPSLGLRLRADDLEARAAALHRRMGEVNEQGHRAFNSAVGAFDSITGTAPQVKALLARARASQDQAPRPLQVLKGIGELALGVVASGADALLGAVDAAQLGVDPVTDALTVADGAAVARLVPGALQDLEALADTSDALDAAATAAAKNYAAGLRTAAATAGKRAPTAAGAAVDRTTGEVFVGHSGELSASPSELADVLPYPSLEPWAPWNCAEAAAATKALRAGSALDNLGFYTVRTTSGEYFPPCDNCITWISGVRP